ncbi:MAG: DUF6753 family protein [Waterburya sp.]
MSLSNAKATEVLELCLASEDPQMRSRVYEIINLSGLDPSDPMFLILALTGQIRVFLEAAPVELQQLLIDWKKQNAESLAEIHRAAAETKENYTDQIEAIKQSLKSVSRECVSDIKEVGMATTSAIAEANSETLDRVQQAKADVGELTKQIEFILTKIESDRKTNREVMTSLVEKFQQTTSELNRANVEFKTTIWSAKKFQQQISWAKRAEWFTPLFALLLMAAFGGIAGAWLTSRFYSSPSEQLGRNLAKWNQKQLIDCINNKSTQCTIKLTPSN